MKTWLDSLQFDATPDMDECVSVLGQHLDWLKELKQTKQDPEWHGEGDVHIHTAMVLQELYQLLESDAAHIQGWQRQALILGTLLHDIGKPRRTKDVEIRGVMRVASPQHEAIGRSYLTFKLMELELPFNVIWTVLGLVGEHHMPKRLVVKNESKGQYLALSRRANLELLYWLEVADMRGRICPDLDKQLQILEEFRLFADDYNVWQKSFFPTALDSLIAEEPEQAKRYLIARAISELEKDAITMQEEAIAKTYEHKVNHSHLVVLCGPSGIGKSSFVKRHYSDYSLVSLDDIREEINGDRSSQKNRGQVVHRAKDALKECLRSKKNVVWDATNLRSDFRKIVCDLGFDYHALVSLVVFIAPEKEIFKGNKNRRYAVPDDVLDKQLESYQFPLVNEAHDYIIANHRSDILWRSTAPSRSLFKELHYD
ncbi:AAA family ATPase [Pleionea sediminis]|uniref:AAA family ATPase n=1 Tax=Pleionea sediminis TaxID=2569479 RepID=UPI001184FFD9|nr:AAA family ATPase [Pleionea sediminis]